ncbi:MAG: hypothetical protein QNJ63_13725 [Calothrix sp. MO_192.B10]|nr:hypothetical protein [Calothrix sp. MO_192.B10]
MSNSKQVFDYQIDLLKEELKHVDGAIRQHDEITKSIKNWAILTWTGSIGFALQNKNLLPFIGLTAIIPVVFWVVDGSFRRIQRSFITRTQEISNFVNSDEFITAAQNGTPFKFDLLVMRHRSHAFKNTLLGAMLFRSVSLLYVGLAICSILIWLMLKTTAYTSPGT